jgi:signal transduction histidine kinase
VIGNSPKRWLLTYLALIAIPTVILLYLQFESMKRQHLTINALTASNLSLSGERLAAEIERSTTWDIELTLHDDDISRIRGLLDPIKGSADARAIRIAFERLRRGHVSFDQFFLMRGGTVLYPLMRLPVELPPNPNTCLHDAQQKEGIGQTELALAAYRNCVEAAPSDSSRALALFAAARCLQKLGRGSPAAEIYAGLVERYADLYDTLSRPYGLSAAMESGNKDLVRRAWSDFVSGRWELSAEQVDWYRKRFQEYLGPASSDDSPFLRHFAIARALEREFRNYSELHIGQIFPISLVREPACQLFYTPIALEAKGETILLVSIKPDWLSQVLPDAKIRSGISADARLIAAGTSEPGRTTVRFRTLFPFRELSMAPENDTFLARQGTYLFAAVTALVSIGLLAGILLLLRDHWRQWEMNRLHASFVSSVSHELKTPLAGIRLYSDMLLQKPHFAESERRDFYEHIGREAERLTLLVEHVLEFARIERRQRPYSLTESDLAVTIANAVDTHALQCLASGIKIQTDFERDLPPVPHDPEAVYGAVVNLLDNAVKYSGDSRLIETRLRACGGSVVFEVRDHGIGIVANERDRIFDEFYRGRNVAATGGCGLGLYLVRHVMDGHGGRVEVKGGADEGSTFALIFVAS